VIRAQDNLALAFGNGRRTARPARRILAISFLRRLASPLLALTMFTFAHELAAECAVAKVFLAPSEASGDDSSRDNHNQNPSSDTEPAEAQEAAADTPGPILPPKVAEAERRRIDAMARAKDAVVAVFAADGGGGGSGVVISPDGFALTNFHVVQPCGTAMKCGMPDGEIYDAVIVGIDPAGDVALIKLFGRDDFPAADIGDSNLVRVGDDCFAMGNPFMLAADFQPTATWGIVSGVHRYQYPAGTLLEYADCLQTDASINPGNSGGPLFNAEGHLIGINGRGSFEKRGRVNVGVAYAISINQIKNFLGHLHSGRLVDHATLGATVDFDAEGNVVVNDILEQSDAYRRGLRYDDEIVSFGGRRITTPNAFKNVLGIFPRGWRVPLVYRRDLEEYEVFVRLRGLHDKEELIEKLQQKPKRPRITPPGGPAPEEPLPGQPRIEGIPLPGRLPSEPKDPDAEPPPGDDGAPGNDPLPTEDALRRWLQAPPSLPDVIEQHFEKRRGYANYYFNERNRQRVLDTWALEEDQRQVALAWKAEGTLSTGGQFELTVDATGCRLVVPGREFSWDAGGAWGDELPPPQSGGLFPALYIWRQLATEGPAGVDEVYYLGRAPLTGWFDRGGDLDALADVLVARHRGLEAHFSFDQQSGQLTLIEFFARGEDGDPCEITLDYGPDGTESGWPRILFARLGTEPYADFRVDRWTASVPGEAVTNSPVGAGADRDGENGSHRNDRDTLEQPAAAANGGATQPELREVTP